VYFGLLIFFGYIFLQLEGKYQIYFKTILKRFKELLLVNGMLVLKSLETINTCYL